nr:attractin-like protein 1 [Penaeus vannamei]
MAADLLKFQFKSKFLRKLARQRTLVVVLVVFSYLWVSAEGQECNLACQHGRCEDNKCVCDVGWKGPLCQWCEGRVRLWSNASVISDGAGNYSTDTQCAWLIDAGQPNTSIRLHLDHFATECSWDHLYVYDGDSIYDPLLAVFSGMVVQDDYQVPQMPEVVAKSGYALLYFYSDAAYSLSGFSISYSHHRVDDCPSTVVGEECSSRGACLEGMCICDMGWRGPACSVPVCPGGCSGNGQCKPEERRCQCHQGYTGTDCSQVIQEGWWEVVSPDITSKLKKANPFSSMLERGSHATVLINNAIWVIGGYSFTEKPFVFKIQYYRRHLESFRESKHKKTSLQIWAFCSGGSIYMYGGMKEDGTITREFWQLDTSSLAWSLVPMEKSSRGGKSRNGRKGRLGRREGNRRNNRRHAAVVVQKVKKNVMLVIFGHSSRYGYLNTVHRCYSVKRLCKRSMLAIFDKYMYISESKGYPVGTLLSLEVEQGNWETIETRGAVVSWCLCHTAVWDPVTSLVYVHGGLHSITSTSQVVPYLMTYDPVKHICCNSWHTMRNPNLYLDVARYGHTQQCFTRRRCTLLELQRQNVGLCAEIPSRRLLLIGSTCISAVKPGLTSSEKCLTAYPGVKCVWNSYVGKSGKFLRFYISESRILTRSKRLAILVSSIPYNCFWCSSPAHGYIKCTELHRKIGSGCLICGPTSCDQMILFLVYMQGKCEEQKSSSLKIEIKKVDIAFHCLRAIGSIVCSRNQPEGVMSLSNGLLNKEVPRPTKVVGVWYRATLLSHKPCQPTCAQRTSCTNCTQSSCMWCFNQQRCVKNNSYLVSFPYGQCREWTTESKRCMDVEPGMSRCSIHQTCEKCQADVACGWCDDGSGTGIGTCMEGGQRGPINPVTKATQRKKCPSPNWYFTQCPLCNCNGHSTCENHSQCIEPCANNTGGSHCQYCVEKFFGKPINGGLCKPCMCNEHGDTCNRETGRCNCHTKGVTGDHCDRCDTQNNYVGEPLKGSCFYDLQIDYQFTFNLSKHEDRHIRQINFFNVPTKSDVDTDFDIQCSKATNIKISSKMTNSHETWIIRNFTGKRIKKRFSSSDYTFGSADNNTTFHVYVYNFTPPIEIIVSFSQHPKLDLVQFFSIFSLCFLILLTLAAILWKIKQKYDIYTRRQRLLVEMEAMASRPFRPILLELYPRGSADTPNANGIICPTPTNTTPTPPPSPQRPWPITATFWAPMALPMPSAAPGVFKANNMKSCNNVMSNATSPDSLPSDTLDGMMTLKKRKKVRGSWPCSGNRAAVLSLLVQLPTGGEPFTPPGHPGGLAIASTLVTLGNPRKCSSDPITLTKGDVNKNKALRGKQPYSSHSPDTCI